MITRLLFPALCAFLIFAAPAQDINKPAAGTASDVTIGGRQIKLPAPDGYVRCDGIVADWDRACSGFLPPDNLLLANFGTAADRDRLDKGEMPVLERNFNLQTLRSLSSQEIGERTFASLRTGMKSELERMAATMDELLKKTVSEGVRKLNQEFNADAALSLGNTVLAGVFLDTETALGFTMLMKLRQTGPNGAEQEDRKAVAAIMAPVNGRLCYFYRTVPYASLQDRRKAEEDVTAWHAAVTAANPRVAGPEIRTSIWSGTLRNALIGGIIGALVVFAGSILFRKRGGKAA